MKRTLSVLIFPLLLSGCAQLFDSNLFQAIDPPPPLNLKNASVSDLQNMMSDPSFLDRLKGDPEELHNAQNTLTDALSDTTASDADRLEAGAALITISSDGSNVSDMASEAIENASSLQDAISGGHYGLALKIFMAGQTVAEMTETLNNLVKMADALEMMQTIAAAADGVPGGPIDSTLFFGSVTDTASFAQSALMAAVGKALVEDFGTTASLAADLALASPTVDGLATTHDLDAFLNAKGASSPLNANDATATATLGSGSSYAYISLTMSKLAISF